METNNGLLNHFRGTTGMKTGYVCASGLNIVATVERGGRRLLAVVLGGSSARERNEMAAELVTEALDGKFRGTGQSVVDMRNIRAEPINMRPLICGKDAKAYVAGRIEAYPMGLDGQPSYPRGRVRWAELPGDRPRHHPRCAAAAPASGLRADARSRR